MNIANFGSSLGGLIFILIFLGIMIAFAFFLRDQPGRNLREIPSFARLRRAIGLAVESGQRLHINLGSGGLQNLRGASGLVGLQVIQRIARAAAISDRPPIATSGSATLAILSQDVMKSSYREVNAENQYDPALGQLTGLTPFSFVAGALPIIFDEQVSVNLLLGSYGSEVALLADAAERTGSLSIGGSENLAAQAILFASVQEPLVGEELFAAGGYLQVNRMHIPSLFTQDVFRWILIVILLVGAFLKLIGAL